MKESFFFHNAGKCFSFSRYFPCFSWNSLIRSSELSQERRFSSRLGLLATYLLCLLTNLTPIEASFFSIIRDLFNIWEVFRIKLRGLSLSFRFRFIEIATELLFRSFSLGCLLFLLLFWLLSCRFGLLGLLWLGFVLLDLIL